MHSTKCIYQYKPPQCKGKYNSSPDTQFKDMTHNVMTHNVHNDNVHNTQCNDTQ